jgi:plasmid stabilization system protein ParE
LRIVFSKAAQRDLRQIQDFLAADNPEVAERVLARIWGVIQLIADGELTGPDALLAKGGRVKRWSIPPYRVYYRRHTQETQVIRVYHQARHPLE